MPCSAVQLYTTIVWIRNLYSSINIVTSRAIFIFSKQSNRIYRVVLRFQTLTNARVGLTSCVMHMERVRIPWEATAATAFLAMRGSTVTVVILATIVDMESLSSQRHRDKYFAIE